MKNRPGRLQRRGQTFRREIPRIKPAADPRLKKVFAKIGSPPEKPFQADPFQLRAVAEIGRADCLVSAPTGSGKTWIAQEAIGRTLRHGGRAWYASPLKALTNSKLLEFAAEFGQERVGILTGDRKENPDAPVIVGTTEILRNQLYDAMHEGSDLGVDLVVLDEAHFLGDEDRGVVWEEIMIYLPQRIHLLLLSATIRNAQQIADWLESIRNKRCVVVEERKRPVPLFPLFFHPTGMLLPLLEAKDIDRKIKKYLSDPNPPLLASPRQLPPFRDVLNVLRRFDLLPAIFFMKSRADCDAALERCMDTAGGSTRDFSALETKAAELTGVNVHLAGHRQMGHLRHGAVGAHHAGQLPAWKLVIERLMTDGLLEAVFATSTVAAGVNFPARSVVFLNSDRYNGHQFVPLDATEFHQATGRAGRRGKDRIGFAVVVPGKFMDVRLMAELSAAPPEDVISRIRVDFSMVLNLLLSHTPDQIEEIFQRSFATFLNVVNQSPGLDRKLKDAGARLDRMLPDARCALPDAVVRLTRQRRALIREISELSRERKELEARMTKTANLVPGRLFLDHRGRLYCVMGAKVKKEEWGVLACRVTQELSLRRGLLPMRWFRPPKVSRILDGLLALPSREDTAGIRAVLVRAAQEGGFRPLDQLPMGDNEHAVLGPITARLEALERELDHMVCNGCRHQKRCHGRRTGPFGRVLDDFIVVWDRVNAVRMRLRENFQKHLQFLKEEGFVGEGYKLTEDGMWASKLRIDQPLIIAEGLRRGVFPDSDPALLAALVAPFVHDRDVEEIDDPSKIPLRLSRAFDRLRSSVDPLAERMAVRGFVVRPIVLWAGETIFAWAGGRSWDETLAVGGMSEGDLSMLVLRTAENLRQIASLTQEYPAIAATATQAIDMLLREPVIIEPQ